MKKKHVKKHVTLFCSFLNTKKLLSLYKFIFVFTPYNIGVILSKKCQGRGFGKICKGGGSYVESCIEGGSDLPHTMNVGQTHVASSLFLLLLVFRLESQ